MGEKIEALQRQCDQWKKLALENIKLWRESIIEVTDSRTDDRNTDDTSEDPATRDEPGQTDAPT